MNQTLNNDRKRYSDGRVPTIQKYFRKCQNSKGIMLFVNKIFYKLINLAHHLEISPECRIGDGLYIGHPYCITLNPKVIIGKNCNIHKGATVGQENSGVRKGVPTIGNAVYIGINSTIVGNITVGDDVLIAPNTYVNCDVPSHSIVLGNPCVIKHRDNATEGYINNKI